MPPLASVTTTTNELETAAAEQQEAKQIAKTKTIAQGQKEDTLGKLMSRMARIRLGREDLLRKIRVYLSPKTFAGRLRLRRRLSLWYASGGRVEIDQAAKHLTCRPSNNTFLAVR